MEVYLHSLLIFALGGGKCTAAGTGRYTPRKESPVTIPPKRRSGRFGQEKNLSPRWDSNPVPPSPQLSHYAKPCNFRDEYMFMNVEKVRIGKKTVPACLQATSWHVPDMTEEIRDRNRKYDQQSDRDSNTIPPIYNCYQHTDQSAQRLHQSTASIYTGHESVTWLLIDNSAVPAIIHMSFVSCVVFFLYVYKYTKDN